MADLVKIGTIGCGGLSSLRIYPCFHKLPLDLVAVCDLDEAKAAETARKFGGKSVYTDYMKMVKEQELDGVIVCVSPAAHPKIAQDIMRAGLPVYTEKPPAPDAAQAAEVVKTSRETGQICMTAFKKRFAPVYNRAKQVIESESFGKPSLLSIDYASGPYDCSKDTDGKSFFLLDFAVHIIDLARFLFGEVEEVFAWRNGPESYSVNFKYADGGLGSLALTCWRSWAVSTEKVEITGSNCEFMTIENSVDFKCYAANKLVEASSPNFSISRGDSLVETGFVGELAEFLSAIKEGRRPESGIESSARTMLVHDYINMSAQEQRPLKIDYSIFD